MKLKTIAALFALLLYALAAQAQTAASPCDLSSFSGAQAFDDIECHVVHDFTPSGHIAGARKISFYNEGYEFFSYLQLITQPGAKGQPQYINVLVQSEYADDGQLQGSGTGGYYMDGDLLYSYIYWDSGYVSTRPYGVERITYQWNRSTSQYRITDYVFSFDGGYAARGWGSSDYTLTLAIDPLRPGKEDALQGAAFDDLATTTEKARYFWGHATHDLDVYINSLSAQEFYNRFAWGKQALELLVEAQQRIPDSIHAMLLRRQIAVCNRANDILECCAQLPDTMNCLQHRYDGLNNYITPPDFSPGPYIQQARVYTVDNKFDDRNFRDTILVTPPAGQGLAQHIPFYTYYPGVFGNYPPQEHRALIQQIGGHRLHQDQLTIYQYWADGCTFDEGLALETQVFQWQPTTQRFERTRRTLDLLSAKAHPRHKLLEMHFGYLEYDNHIEIIKHDASIQLPEDARAALMPLLEDARQHSHAYCCANGLGGENCSSTDSASSAQKE